MENIKKDSEYYYNSRNYYLDTRGTKVTIRNNKKDNEYYYNQKNYCINTHGTKVC